MIRGFFVRNQPFHPAPKPPIPGRLQVRSSTDLLSRYQQQLDLMVELAGVDRSHFDAYYRAAINAYARFVQMLPASEVHHHCGPYGLLEHGLDVTVTALKLRRSYLLPQGAETEIIAVQQDLWTYAVFSAALCHDLAKPAVDQIVHLLDDDGRNRALWDPWSYFLDEQGTGYRSNFVKKRQYRLHEKASLLLVHRIVPPCGLSWLASDRKVLAYWLACISGDLEEAGVIGEIVIQADGQSVAKNLGAESRPSILVTTKPLHEKLLTSLRFLINEGELPLNRNGAAGWVTGEDCWLVSKRTVDSIRAQLTTEGHTGIPTKNGRLFDVLQEHGILVSCSGKAIWRATIKGEDFEHDLTLIRIPVSRIWHNLDSRPSQFEGTVIPAEPQTESIDVPTRTNYSDPSNAQEGTSNVSVTTPESLGSSIMQFLPSNVGLNVIGEGEDLQTDDFVPIDSTDIDGNTSAVQNAESTGTTTLLAKHNNAEPFVEWVRSGILNKTLKVNEPKARLHVVKEGVLLVTPGIFQNYADTAGLDWVKVQKAFLKCRWHVKTAAGLNVHVYVVKGKNRTSKLNGILLKQAVILFGTNLPNTNRYLSCVESNHGSS